MRLSKEVNKYCMYFICKKKNKQLGHVLISVEVFILCLCCKSFVDWPAVCLGDLQETGALERSAFLYFPFYELLTKMLFS